ncbi:MAG: hypothetical protein ACNI3A_07875 [Desulfovibrio sp.]|uniref:hypothetical protein n=1 Tax=Desulfovibrio sp. 7SRBS1 TaxID=3378064 RepID=UPI003B3FEDDD
MCRAKTLQILNRLGMRLAGQKEHRAALTLLALALRESLQAGSQMYEAKVRNNMALVFGNAGKSALAERQLARAMRLTEAKVGTDNKFYKVLSTNLAGLTPLSSAAPAYKAATCRP